MSDFPALVEESDQAFGVLAAGAGGSPLGESFANSGVQFSTVSTSVWPSASLAVFCPVLVRRPSTVAAMAWWNGSTVSGNVDAGIFDRNGTRLAHTGSTAQAGTGQAQVVALSGGSVAIPPGLYYLAMAVDNTTALFGRALFTAAAVLAQACGAAQMAAAFPLPTTATFAAYTQTVFPLLAAQIGAAL